MEERAKKKPAKVKKVAQAPKTVKKAKVKEGIKPVIGKESDVGTTKLTSLSGLGPATASKFEELGVSSVEDLVKEDPAELASLIKGVSEERITNWINECKELLNK
ncbi:MAG: helix-hairpin-helix domain-containing protein [Candidatus Hermodarchaeota archaeon]